MMLSSKTARNVLIALTLVNYLNYIDRFMLAALLPDIQKALHFSDFSAGLLATAFMLAYVIAAPFFGYLGDKLARVGLLSSGIALWSAASLLTGFAGQFRVLFTSRFALGIGESIFTTVSAPFLVEFFPEKVRGRVFSIFASAAPVGAALGYVLGGVLGKSVGWRDAFLWAGVPGLVLALGILKFQDPRMKTAAGAAKEKQKKYALKDIVRILAGNRIFTLTVLGYTAYTFVLGGLAHWMPSYIQRSFQLPSLQSNMLFGGIAVGTGFLGTLLGGFWGDKLAAKYPHGHLQFSTWAMFLAVPFFLACFCVSSLMPFIVLMSITQFLFFLPTSPINVLIMNCVPANLRTNAMAVSIFACHILGDAISSPLVGLVSDHSSLRIGIVSCAPFVLLSALIWFYALKVKTPTQSSDQASHAILGYQP